MAQNNSVREETWQNAYVERLIGSIRRDCLAHVLIFDERGLPRILQLYFDYTNDLALICPWQKTLRFLALSNHRRWEG